MKKAILFLMLPLLAVALSLNSCSKDGGDDNGKVNEFTINGKTYDLTSGYMTKYSHDDLPNVAYIEIYLGYGNEKEHEAAIDNKSTTGVEMTICVPSNATGLKAGTYPFTDSDSAFTFNEGFVDENGQGYGITGGSIIVAVSGNTYTIKVDCTFGNGGTVKGTYKGSLPLV